MAYVIVSDVHLHSWSAFSSTLESGVNSRLQIILDELRRAGQRAKEIGGHLYCAGDLFHVRGSVAPSVLNPTLDLFREIVESGVEVRMIPGNHDLESKDAKRLTNANQALASVGVKVCNEPTFFDDDMVLMMPWFDKQKELMGAIDSWCIDWKSEEHGEEVVDGATLIIHAGMNGVIRGIPDTGIEAKDLAEFGFSKVLVGHYHNHKDFGNGVYSVGATTHQTWGDIGTRAGFMEVSDDGEVVYHDSLAPRFVNVSDPEDLSEVEGNYVRVKLESATEDEIAQIKQEVVEEHGALACVVMAVPKSKVVERTGATVEAGASTERSISDWIDSAELDEAVDKGKLLEACLGVYSDSAAAI